MNRYRFDDVSRALHTYLGLSLSKGERDDRYDGRWDVSHSRTGYVVSGSFPGGKHTQVRYRSLAETAEIVRHCDLAKIIEVNK